MGKGMELIYFSDVERGKLVAELWCDGSMWGEVDIESGVPRFTLCTSSVGVQWNAPLDAVLAALNRARDGLVSRA